MTARRSLSVISCTQTHSHAQPKQNSLLYNVCIANIEKASKNEINFHRFANCCSLKLPIPENSDETIIYAKPS